MHPPQGFRPLRRRAVSHGIFEFGDDRRLRRLLRHSMGGPLYVAGIPREIWHCDVLRLG